MLNIDYIKKYIKIICVQSFLILLIIELLFLIIYKFNLLTLSEIYTPSYIREGVQAELVFDKNGSSIYVNGKKSYFSSRNYDKFGFMNGDYEKIKKSNKLWYFFGDSYTEGLQVSKKDTFSDLLEKTISEKKQSVDIINLGVGGTGTFQSLLRLKTLLEIKKPKKVVLFFLPLNDVMNNSKAYAKTENLPKASYTNSKDFPKVTFTYNQQIEILKKPQNIFIKTLTLIAKNLFSGRILYSQYKQYKAKKLYEESQNKDEPFIPKDMRSWLNVYNKPNNNIMNEAWEITEKSILEFFNILEKIDIDFSMVITPDAMQIFHYKNPISNYDFEYPNIRLMKFCRAKKITCYDALPYFKKYLDEKNITFPYFSYKNDGHYSNVGHRVMTNYLYEVLLDN